MFPDVSAKMKFCAGTVNEERAERNSSQFAAVSRPMKVWTIPGFVSSAVQRSAMAYGCGVSTPELS